MHDWTCCTCDEHRSLSRSGFGLWVIRKNNHLFLNSWGCLCYGIGFYSTDNGIGDTGATSLSESLKSNTTLTKLNLSREDKRKKTHKRHSSTIHSFPFPFTNRQRDWRKRSNITMWSIEIKHNPYSTRSGEWRQKKEDTQKASINNSLFPFLFTSTDNKIGDTGATSLSEVLKSNTTLAELNLRGENQRKKTHKRHSSANHSFPFSSQQQTTTLEKEE